MDVDSDSYTTARAEATQSALKALAFVAMLLYPAVSTSIFNALRCRQLGEASSWLEADYTVSCLDRRYSFYAAAAYVLVVVVPIGFPLILLGALGRQWRRSCELWIEPTARARIQAARTQKQLILPRLSRSITTLGCRRCSASLWTTIVLGVGGSSR